MIRGFFFSPGPVFFLALLFFLSALFISCAGTRGQVRETPLPVRTPAAEAPAPARPSGSGGGVADEIRSLVEAGTPPSLTRAMELIRDRGLENGEFGRIMSAAGGALIQKLYPDLRISLPARDSPQTHNYTRILREGERGIYTAPAANSTDYLEWVLPFLAFFSETKPSPPENLLPNLLKAEEFNPGSVLAPLFLGLFYEQRGRLDEAGPAYERALGISGDCYPAVLGLARIKGAGGQEQEAIRLLSDLAIRYPDNMTVKRQLARAYYRSGDWSRAESAVAEVLQRDSRNGEFILMRARALVEQGQFLQAQAPLDIYATINPNDRLYLFLRARVQAEGYRNRDAALTYLRSLLRSAAVDDEALIYAVRLLLESARLLPAGPYQSG
ncbi:MAG: tetratricopeptide repeat protein, partial [Treponema sp.]|nr:tetratricopeptide repeat protein [Treponema sp.]